MKRDARTAFLKAIAEAPDDDGPRLVYADWLEEHGDPARAEFIRVRCELGDGGVASLAGSRHLGQLRSLALGQNQMSDAGARALAASPHLEGLRSLVVWHKPLTAAGME